MRSIWLWSKLHELGILHGDPSIANIIQLPDWSLRWIDLRYPTFSIAQDGLILVESVFGLVIANQDGVQEAIFEYEAEVSAEQMANIYNLCLRLHGM